MVQAIKKMTQVPRIKPITKRPLKPIVKTVAATGPKWDLASLKALKPVKNLILGDRSSAVVLLEQGVVMKSYDKNSRAHIQRYNKEVEILRKVQGCNFVPKLYFTDDVNKTMYMEYVGKNGSLSTDQKLAVNRALKHLAEHYHVFRVKGGKAGYSYRDLFPGNICIGDHGKVFLIDYGSNRWLVDDINYKKRLGH